MMEREEKKVVFIPYTYITYLHTYPPGFFSYFCFFVAVFVVVYTHLTGFHLSLFFRTVAVVGWRGQAYQHGVVVVVFLLGPGWGLGDSGGGEC